jgi:YVTN family beta-propeller protein
MSESRGPESSVPNSSSGSTSSTQSQEFTKLTHYCGFDWARKAHHVCVVVDKAGATLYVANRLSSDVSVIDLTSGQEIKRLLTGRGNFVDDRPVALHVAFRRSEHGHARLVSIDCAAARAAPGVIAVLTADDLAVKPLVAASRMKGYYATPILPLARDKVRYVGEPVVGVIAENRYLAEDALEAIAIEFEPLAHAADPEQAAQAGSPLLHDEAGTNVLVARETCADGHDDRAAHTRVFQRKRGRFVNGARGGFDADPKRIRWPRIRAGENLVGGVHQDALGLGATAIEA